MGAPGCLNVDRVDVHKSTKRQPRSGVSNHREWTSTVGYFGHAGRARPPPEAALHRVRRQGVVARVRSGRQHGQDVLEVSPSIMAFEFDRLDQTHQGGEPLTGLLAAHKQPILSPHRNRANHALHRIVVHRDAPDQLQWLRVSSSTLASRLSDAASLCCAAQR